MRQRCLLALTVPSKIFNFQHSQAFPYHLRDKTKPLDYKQQYLRSLLLLRLLLLLRRWWRRLQSLALRRPLLLLHLLFLFLPGGLRSTRCLYGSDRTFRLRLGLNLRLKLSLWLKLKLRYTFRVGRRRMPCFNLGFSFGRRFRRIPVSSKTQNRHVSIRTQVGIRQLTGRF